MKHRAWIYWLLLLALSNYTFAEIQCEVSISSDRFQEIWIHQPVNGLFDRFQMGTWERQFTRRCLDNDLSRCNTAFQLTAEPQFLSNPGHLSFVNFFTALSYSAEQGGQLLLTLSLYYHDGRAPRIPGETRRIALQEFRNGAALRAIIVDETFDQPLFFSTSCRIVQDESAPASR